MKLLRPVTITEPMLVSSTVPEADHAAWAIGTTYAKAARVIKGHRIWESLLDGNTGHDPETDTSDPPNWLLVSSTNRWRMFDSTVNSLTTATGSIVVELQAGTFLNAVAGIELVGQTMKVELLDGATVVYSSTQSIDVSPVNDWYDYFFAPFEFAPVLLFEGVPSYLNGTLRITITGAQVSCGGLVIGQIHGLGETLQGASAGITDYSRKTTNPFGVTELVERPWTKRASLRFLLDARGMHRLQLLLASVRATLCLWVGEESDPLLFAPLVIYGNYRDFSIDVPGRIRSYCSLELEGVI